MMGVPTVAKRLSSLRVMSKREKRETGRTSQAPTSLSSDSVRGLCGLGGSGLDVVSLI